MKARIATLQGLRDNIWATVALVALLSGAGCLFDYAGQPPITVQLRNESGQPINATILLEWITPEGVFDNRSIIASLPPQSSAFVYRAEPREYAPQNVTVTIVLADNRKATQSWDLESPYDGFYLVDIEVGENALSFELKKRAA